MKEKNTVKKILMIVLLAFCLVGPAGVGQAMAEVSTFMFVPGIKGSSTDARHKDWIDVGSLTQTLEHARRNPQCSLKVVKGLDISGPLLWAAAVNGQLFGEIQIDVTKNGGDGNGLVYQIKLHNAHVTNISTMGSLEYVEQVTLDAGSVQLIFFNQGIDGRITQITSSFAC